MTAAIALAAALTAASATFPLVDAVVSPAPERVAVTIYRDRAIATEHLVDAQPEEGLAQITETRVLELPAGRSTVRFEGVADRIVPQTASVSGLAATLLERNVDYDLLSPGSLLQRSVGKTVRLIRTNPANGHVTETSAVVRSGPIGVVLETGATQEALGCSNLPERIVFDSIPQGLAERPTLSVAVDAPTAGRHQVKLTYLATGMSWSADYIATLSNDGRHAELLGWITLANRTGTTFGGAPTQVVAGDLSRDEDTQPIEADALPMSRGCWASPFSPPSPPPPSPLSIADAGGANVEEIVVTASRARQGELGDYKLYTLPGPTTVSARQIKQVAFLHAPQVAVETLYAYGGDDLHSVDDAHPVRVLRIDNRRAGGLGQPLPVGNVAVTTNEGILVGEHRLDDDVPIGLTTDLELGTANDVVIRTRVVQETSRGDHDRTEMEIEFINAKPEPVSIEYWHETWGDPGRVVAGRRPDGTRAGSPLWKIRLAAGVRQTLRYTIEE